MNSVTINGTTTIGGAEPTLLAGRYRVVRQLGQGGMGSVWLAEDTKLDGHPVAIKMLPAILVANRRAYQQVKAEALLSLKLSHPNIVTMRAFEEEGGNPFLVMDYIEGRTLDDYLAEKGRLSEAETMNVLKPIAAALDYAHGEGVVHRDVKPANIMIRNDGRPFILDFGIGREVQETMTAVTGRSSSGTLLYMGPEQLKGEVPKSAQDIYSLAATAYECLTGHPPFYRGQIEYQIINEPPTPCSPASTFSETILKGLAKTPDGRPATCTALFLETGGQKNDVTVDLSRHKPGDMMKIALPGGETMEFAWCPPGSFMMGSPESEEGHTKDEVQHRVTLTKGFWMGKYEVTQKQWESVMGTNPSEFKGGDRPVDSVSWWDCKKFIAKCNSTVKGMRFALPTEAQWEYACRAGTTTAFNFGMALNGECANCDGNHPYGTSVKGTFREATTPVGSFAPNDWGLYDMHGNVWEWCADWFGDYDGAMTDPTGPASGDTRVMRGGEWRLYAHCCRSARRDGFWPAEGEGMGFGFRLVCTVEQDGISDVVKSKDFVSSCMSSGVVQEVCSRVVEPQRIQICDEQEMPLVETDIYLVEAEAKDLFEQKVVHADEPTDSMLKNLFRRLRTLHTAATSALQHGDCVAARRLFAEFAQSVANYDSAVAEVVRKAEEVRHTELDRRREAERKAEEACQREAEEKRLSGVGVKAGDVQEMTLPGGAKMKFVWCPPGTFTMGSPTDEEWPQHRVTLTKGFWMGQYEVTQAQWQAVMGDNPSRFRGDDNLPVECVSWEDCQNFIEKCNATARGVRFALPTEAQWEYACRAGSTGPYAGMGDLDAMGWYDGNSGRKTHPVGQKQPNAWNLYDMHGNVHEWCADWYGSYEGDCTDPTGPASGKGRVIRGGGWDFSARSCRSAYRCRRWPGFCGNYFGFRILCSAGPHGK